MKQVWITFKRWILQVKHLKYWLVGGTFLVLMLFFDHNNLFKRISDKQEISRLQNELGQYNKEIDANRKKINELQSNDANLEKFAREVYLMKRPGEDVYIIPEK